MKFLLACAVFATLAGCLDAGPAGPAGDSPTFLLSIKSFLAGVGLIDDREEEGHHVSKRQSALCTTTNTTGCFPPGVTAVPMTLIECVMGQCLCKDCFEIGPDGVCMEVSCEDWRYNQPTLKCDDDRPSQLTAFLLSFFLSSTGAANFYIGRDGLAGGQLFLMLLMFAAVYSMCCIPCCMGCCMAKDEVKGSVFFIGLMLLIVVVVVLCMLANWAWWLADLIIFATNQRDSGNGCMLRENL